MNGETTRDLLLILVMAMVTFATRLLPFLLFDRGEEPPKAVLYLGRVLPPAVIAMLIIYCLRSPSVEADAQALAGLAPALAGAAAFLWGWAPQLIAALVVVLMILLREISALFDLAKALFDF